MLLSATSIQPWNSTFKFASKCTTQKEINQIHGNLIATGNIHNPNLTSKIILNFAFSHQKPNINFARHLFFEFHYRDPFLWNAIIRSFSHGDDPEIAFQLFVLMLVRGILVDAYSFSLVLKSCSRMQLLSKGFQIHGLLLKLGFRCDVFLQNSLINLYTKCGNFQLAQQVFDKMPKKDSFSYNLMIAGVFEFGMISLARELFDKMPLHLKNLVSWNTMISGYLKSENGFDSAIKLFDKMPERDLVSWNLVIDFCAKNGQMEMARVLFDLMLERDVMTWASMIYGYAKLGCIDIARSFFDAMPQRDVVSCNAMMVGYVNNGHCHEALKVFHDMLGSKVFNLAPDCVTLLTALSAVAQLGCINEGILIHRYIEEHGFGINGKLGVALVNMYAKCGSIDKAMHVFERVKEKTTVDHWNAMIGGLAIHGMGGLAFNLFIEMERLAMNPDSITFIAVLHACGHSGMVKEGLISFEIMQRVHKIMPEVEHYGCLVDILSRSGKVEYAARIIERMPVQPNTVVWRTLLSASTNHERLNIGEAVAKRLIRAASCDSGSYILASNMYARSGLWECVRMVRDMMKERELSKVPGCSWIEVEGRVHEFFAGRESNNGIGWMAGGFTDIWPEVAS